MKFAIKNRWSDAVIFEAEIERAADADTGFGLRLAVRAAVEAHANLVHANLADANLAGANLAGAKLADANLAHANLAGAKLAGANLTDANLADANLAGANLAGAKLAGANLTDANLAHANLAGAKLTDANLADANLADANLAGANLAGAKLAHANLAGAKLAGANLADANLADANLAGAKLAGANLAHANLVGANLTDANLADANLAGANLARTKGLKRALITPLLLLRDQPGDIIAYKLVTANGIGPYNGGITYEIGKSYSVDNADTDECEPCGKGINVADLHWCAHEWRKGYRILRVSFTAADIACIPTANDGKFRLHRCKVISEVDLVAIGLVAAQPAKEAAA